MSRIAVEPGGCQVPCFICKVTTELAKPDAWLWTSYLTPSFFQLQMIETLI